MKKRNNPQRSGNPMKGDMSFAYNPPSPPRPTGYKLDGDLILKPETWKKINDIAANPEKYLNDEAAIREEWGLE